MKSLLSHSHHHFARQRLFLDFSDKFLTHPVAVRSPVLRELISCRHELLPASKEEGESSPPPLQKRTRRNQLTEGIGGGEKEKVKKIRRPLLVKVRRAPP